MRSWKLAIPVIFACACTVTIEGPPLDDGIAGGGSTSTSGSTSTGGSISTGGSTSTGGSISTGGSTSIGGSSTTTGGLAGTASAPPSGGASSSGTSAGGTGVSGAGVGGAGSGGGSSGSGNTTGGAGAGGRALGGASGSGVAGAAATGGTSTAGAGGTTGPTFAEVGDIIVRTCASSMCHGGRRNPNLTAANLYTTLTSTQVRQCGNDRLVTARDATNSALLEVVKGQCGNLVMPEGCDVLPCLDPAEITTITDWIAAGALR